MCGTDDSIVRRNSLVVQVRFVIMCLWRPCHSFLALVDRVKIQSIGNTLFGVGLFYKKKLYFRSNRARAIIG